MARREEDIRFHQGNGQYIIEPIRDGQTGDYLDLSQLGVGDVHYRIAEEYDDSTQLFEAPDSQISIDTWGNTAGVWPDRLANEGETGIPEPSDSTDVIIIDIQADDTEPLAPASNETSPELVHELKITSAGDIGADVDAITVFQGTVLVLPSATVTVN
jgi:hypothetical protein